jgi:protein ImuA
LVVADLPSPPGLTPVRRLHLAAEAAGTAPLGLLLCPDIGGAAGIETRWHMAPAHEGSTAPRWRLERLRARALPPKAWVMQGMGAPAQLQPVPDHTAIGARPT